MHREPLGILLVPRIERLEQPLKAVLETFPGTQQIISVGQIVMNKPVAIALELTQALRQGLDELRRTVDAQRIEEVLSGRLENGNPSAKEQKGDALFVHAVPLN